MALLQRKTDEERALDARRNEARRRAREYESYLRSPPGQARVAYERGDHVFQYSIDVMSQQAIIVAMVGSTTSKKTTDPTVVLNAVCREGWELVNGSFVFVEQGQQSRDKFLTSGQNVATKGTTVGYYLFRRCEPNRVEHHHATDYRPQRPTVDDAIKVFESGEIELAASMMGSVATVATTEGEIQEIAERLKEMRALLDAADLDTFDEAYRAAYR